MYLCIFPRMKRIQGNLEMNNDINKLLLHFSVTITLTQN